MKTIELYDTTLRDGTQGEGIDFSPREKLRIAQRLDRFGLLYIEGGWPGSNPRDQEFFKLAQAVKFKQARLVAFGSTRRPGIACEEDKNLLALLEVQTPAVAIFGKSWLLHVKKVMDNTPGENLVMIRQSVGFLKERGKEVIYDAEHFFQGYQTDPDYAVATLLAAHQGGADWLVLCDTNGGSLPSQIREAVLAVRRRLSSALNKGARFKLGIHAHNDCGLAVANSLEAVQAGVEMVQGTINGYGERCGNADLTTVIPTLQLKMGANCVSAKSLVGLRGLSLFVNETANMNPRRNQPFIGLSAFTHKGGVHVSAVMKTSRAYEHIRPELVGNRRRVLVSDLSGRSNVRFKAQELGISLLGQGDVSQKVVQEIKRLEKEGHQFDAAEASLIVLLKKCTDQYQTLFELEKFFVTVEKEQGQPSRCQATLKIKVRGHSEHVVADGEGPVGALDNALRLALKRFYPGLHKVRLLDYKVRVLNGHGGADSKVRVLITTGDQDDVWTTVGVSKNIIEASWLALLDSYHYKLAGGGGSKRK